MLIVRNTMKWGFKYILTFAITVTVLVSMLVGAALIPKELIRQNVLESANYLCEGELFGEIWQGVEGSKIDRYADSILLGIAYQYDREDPLTSVLWSSYYHTIYQNENYNLLDAVQNDYVANKQYMRYWHGSNAIVRPLLIYFNLPEIYIWNGIILSLLFLILLIYLLSKKAFLPVWALLIGAVVTGSWFVPLSLEYTWTYLWMLIISFPIMKLAQNRQWQFLGALFMISGMVTNYLDFLTTETLTLLVPLLLSIWFLLQGDGKNNRVDVYKYSFKAVICWGTGYTLMWLAKWLISYCIFEQNVLKYISSHIDERISGNVGKETGRVMIEAVTNNIKLLFPLDYGTTGAIIFLFLIILVLYIGYVYHKPSILKGNIILYLVLALIPYVRYLVLHNHSYLHDYFTYRAQLSTVIAIIFILEEAADIRSLLPIDKNTKKFESKSD